MEQFLRVGKMFSGILVIFAIIMIGSGIVALIPLRFGRKYIKTVNQ